MNHSTWSTFGDKLNAPSGIHELMKDLGEAFRDNASILMMGGGTPSHIPEVEQQWRRRMEEVLRSPGEFECMMGDYEDPQGYAPFLDAVASYLNTAYGWPVTRRNIAVTAGGQTAFFSLFNLLAGSTSCGGFRRILMPLAPEYIGYADQGICADMFVSCRPAVELIGDHRFKYHIDMDRLPDDGDIAALCVSRPTNPSGNVITDDELRRLSDFAGSRSRYLLIDNAYGAPFPHVMFKETAPLWDRHVILTMSLSKLGLPSVRTGVVVADEDIIRMITTMNSIVGLSVSGIGQRIVTPMIEDGSLRKLSREVICPFYRDRSNLAQQALHHFMDDALPYRVHESEGAFFLWLWLKDLPGGSMALYQALKKNGVLVVPGDYFFYGLAEDWPHRHECIRISYVQDEDTVRRGMEIIADTVKQAYARKDAP